MLGAPEDLELRSPKRHIVRENGGEEYNCYFTALGLNSIRRQEGMRMVLAEGDDPTSLASQVSWSDWSTPAICEGSIFLRKDLVSHPSFLLPWI